MSKKNEQKKQFLLKRNFKKFKFWIFIACLLVILIPVIIHFLYKIPAVNDIFVAIIPPQDLLAYEGTIIGSLFLFLTVYITIKNTKKDNELSSLKNAMSDFIGSIDIAIDFKISMAVSNYDKDQLIKNMIESFATKFMILNLFLSEEDKNKFLEYYNKFSESFKKETDRIQEFYNKNNEYPNTNFLPGIVDFNSQCSLLFREILDRYNLHI